MLSTNQDIANLLITIADALEEQDDNPYRIRAFRRAAKAVLKCQNNIVDLVNQNEDLTCIPSIGKRLAALIKEAVVTGNIPYYPTPKPAKPYPVKFHNKKRKQPSFKIYTIMPIIEKILKRLEELPEVKKVECASDYRRKKEIVSDIDIIIESHDAVSVFAKFYTFPSVKYIIKRDESTTIVELKIGLRVTLHNITDGTFAAKLLQMTGSIEHYEILINRAKEKNLHLTSEGLFDHTGIKSFSKSENDIYEALSLTFIPPELRENRGEIQAAAEHRLPKLIGLSDILGDLHCHTNETDGLFSLEEMVQAAKKQGYDYVAITDHSQSLKITNGMDEKRLLRQIKQIDRLNESFSNFTILKSIEVDILEDGSLDLPNSILQELDFTVCSIHSKFRLSCQKQTERILKAMDNPYFTILGHATGRLIKHRPPYQLDIDIILQAAKERNCFIEVNAQPARLDINDIYCQKAKQIGVKVAISSDAHTINGFNFMILGVNQARRGWLEASDVINSYKLPELRKLIYRN